MNRRLFLGAMGSLFADPDTPKISTDTDRHKLATTTRTADWIETQLEASVPLNDGLEWIQLDSEYILPKSSEEVTTYATVLNALIDAPYRVDYYDCEKVSMQLTNLFGRVGINIGLAVNNSHAFCLMIAGDQSLIKWEPQLTQDVTEWEHEKYTLEDGKLLL